MKVYEMVTERIIKQLGQGYIPWRKPWIGCPDGTFNRISRKPYSILNQLLLKNQGEYATFKQWEQLGGHVRKGEKAEIVVFWKLQEVQEKQENGELILKNVPLLRYYNVFHISQVENVLPLVPQTYETEPIQAAERVLSDYIDREQIKLHIGGNQAFYRLSDDCMTLPDINQFKQSEEYYSTAFHETVHSTMKIGRCDREMDNQNAYFGNSDYSKEELIAEIGASAIMNFLKIETSDTFRNNAAYIQSWLKVLQNDNKFIVSASGKAEKAVKYILDMA